MPFLPLFEKKMTCGIVSSGIQSMVNDAFLFDDVFNLMMRLYSMMRFILKLYFLAPHSHHFQSFLSISFKL
ncbi:hypothetical protein KVD01_00315 [Helicobacter pylori]|nr:hypothetical protein KVD01_04935 [Helicobacter pylori]WRE26944.1 hypothetical protein KVD01_00315 [Helicobacter pylori]